MEILFRPLYTADIGSRRPRRLSEDVSSDVLRGWPAKAQKTDWKKEKTMFFL